MTGSSTCSSSPWMLPLLLPLFILLQQSSPAPTRHEFSINVDSLGKEVGNCNTSCSPLNVTDVRCRCIKFELSEEKRCFPHNFIEALKSLNVSLSKDEMITDTITELENMSLNKSEKTCLNPGPHVVSPKCLHKSLDDLKMNINSESAHFLPLLQVECNVLDG